MVDGYIHGQIACRICFPTEGSTLTIGNWRLHNDPGYYGSNQPRVLVLGFSKGATQEKTAIAGDFDRIAFAGFRPRLQKVLETLGLMPTDRGIDDLLTASEKEFGFASLVRCSLCKMLGETCVTSGAMIRASFRDPSTRLIIQRCTKKFLGELPKSIGTVVLLGTSAGYLIETQKIFRELYADFRMLNPVAFRAREALWIYAAHPSPANSYFKSWLEGDSNEPSGRKRELARAALCG